LAVWGEKALRIVEGASSSPPQAKRRAYRTLRIPEPGYSRTN
jgi:hypothetical protein